MGGNGSYSQINIIAGSNPPPVSIYTDVTDSDVFNTISLNANKSYFFGDQIASVTWEQISGPTISLSDIHSENPTFSIPGSVIKDQTLEFKLTLEDYQGQNYSDTFIISASAIKKRIDSNGLPYSENFSSTLFKDQSKTTMDWSVTEYKGILLKPAIRQNAFSQDTTIGKEISMLTDNTFSMCVADIDGDGDNDLIVGNKLETNLLYLNNGGADPFKNVVGTAISNDRFESFSMDTGDIDGDGDIDLIASGESNPIRIYLNNGTSNPFFGVNGINLSDHSSFTLFTQISGYQW
ncbi:MAG: hypothetical protein OMM_05764 [Candidatus Magnetoglobus multicellularis str. Araruama]|uniref:VCBS repeat-containing protein n=1 Tax=Candidatus Magnetoglobus multicellularis str. Araruama TaxID=890399 RepID=A0A1V1NUE2_9BACT|nr:MAG: hypothetical protein OMM_05764 [Candidatus Magnetoglobus multicellularis str. Araruama]